MNIACIIPSRFESSRFPGKPLIDINGKTMIHRVYEQCKQVPNLSKVIIATDDVRIYNEVHSFGGDVIMTSVKHLNGTSRCAEVLNYYTEKSDENFDYVINIQGDEPFIHPNQIVELTELFSDKEFSIVTQVKKETDLSLLNNPNIVKAILNENNEAIDFLRIIDDEKLRSLIYDSGYFYKHIGIYGFKSLILSELVKLLPTNNEIKNHLEQLRWLDNGYKIKAGITEYDSVSIDTKEDLEKVKRTLDL